MSNFNNGNNYNDDNDDDDEEMRKKMMMITIGTVVMMIMRMLMPIKEGDSLLQAVYLEVIIAGKYFNFRISSMYKLINLSNFVCS